MSRRKDFAGPHAVVQHVNESAFHWTYVLLSITSSLIASTQEATKAAINQSLTQLLVSMHGQLSAGSSGECIWLNEDQTLGILKIPSQQAVQVINSLTFSSELGVKAHSVDLESLQGDMGQAKPGTQDWLRTFSAKT